LTRLGDAIAERRAAGGSGAGAVQQIAEIHGDEDHDRGDGEDEHGREGAPGRRGGPIFGSE
jgi:hypothetical protein